MSKSMCLMQYTRWPTDGCTAPHDLCTADQNILFFNEENMFCDREGTLYMRISNQKNT